MALNHLFGHNSRTVRDASNSIDIRKGAVKRVLWCSFCACVTYCRQWRNW